MNSYFKIVNSENTEELFNEVVKAIKSVDVSFKNFFDFT